MTASDPLSDLIRAAVRAELVDLQTADRPPFSMGTREAAGWLGVSESTVKKLIREGRLAALQAEPGGKYVIGREAVERALRGEAA